MTKKIQRGETPRAAARARGGSETLGAFLRDVGRIPLLEASRERELAQTIRESRAALARIAVTLPRSVRDEVLTPDAPQPDLGPLWPIQAIEDFCTAVHARTVAGAAPPLSRRCIEQIDELKRGLDVAREAFVVANLRLVVHVAKNFSNHHIPFIDLVQEGNIGLLRAVEKFDHRRGYKFSTYAYWWIKQAIGRAIDEKGRTIRLPVHVWDKLKKLEGVAPGGSLSGSDDANLRAAAQKAGLQVDTVRFLLGIVQDPVSIEDLRADERGDPLSFLSDPEADSPLDLASRRQISRLVDRCLKGLAPREERVLRLRFGLGENGAHTLEEIGRRLSLSRERVRQIENNAIKRLVRGKLARELRELAS